MRNMTAIVASTTVLLMAALFAHRMSRSPESTGDG
jgi:hypothetical protein